MANNRLDSPAADEPANGIGLPRRREWSWHSVYRQEMLMMRPLGGDGCILTSPNRTAHCAVAEAGI